MSVPTNLPSQPIRLECVLIFVMLHCNLLSPFFSLQRTFASYTTLVGMAYNPHLPQLVRAAVVDLILVLYLDR
jgi:hypothetical protein